MFWNRISRFLIDQTPPDPPRHQSPPGSIVEVGNNGDLLFPPGTFVAAPLAGFQDSIYEIARQQAHYEVQRRRRRAFYGAN